MADSTTSSKRNISVPAYAANSPRSSRAQRNLSES